MAKKKLITLAKELDFTTEQEYFDYLIDTRLNGQFSACKRLFEEMSKKDKKYFLYYIQASESPKAVYDYYFNLL